MSITSRRWPRSLAAVLAASSATCSFALAGVGPEKVGRWLTPQPWPVVAVHGALLPSGKVVHYGGSLTMTWNPRSGEFGPFELEQNLFCSGLTFLADGTLYVVGGTGTRCDTEGLFATHIFDTFAESWTLAANTNVGRWYPTAITLGTGQVVIFSGDDSHCNPAVKVELYSPGEPIAIIPVADRLISLFPRMHLLSSGLIAHVGPESDTYVFDLSAAQWQFVADTLAPGLRYEGTSVLLPGSADRVMIIGGEQFGTVTDTCEIIDFAAPAPQWVAAAKIHNARAHADTVILPDGTVMLVGGATSGPYGGALKIPELYDPLADSWTELPAHHYPRGYHATTLLLPDGRVLSAGQDFGASAVWSEIYEPAYLFRGARPAITGGASVIGYGQSFVIETADAPDIENVALIRLSSITHSVNFSQRHVALEFQQQSGSELVAIAPSNANFLPPGPYMLFILNGLGVPSEARMILVSATPSPDLDGDGAVGIIDFLALLAAWGTCPGEPVPCLQDLNGDGVVGIIDMLLLLGAWDPGTNCPGAGDCCQSNSTPGCDDGPCCDAVCATDPLCCDLVWDNLCAAAAVELCGCDPALVSCGAGTGNCCEANGTSGCDDLPCCEVTCLVDPFCCEVVWDEICAEEAQALCIGVCFGGPSDCCFPHEEPGCHDGVCRTLVCAIEVACCTVAWDQLCVDLAATECGDLCLACPGEGDCCEAGSTPGCEDVDCCNAICNVDPFCCEIIWDEICAAQGIQYCGCPEPVICGPGAGDCCNANGTPGCDDVACCKAVCAADPFCCDTEWDTICADIAMKLCGLCP